MAIADIFMGGWQWAFISFSEIIESIYEVY